MTPSEIGERAEAAVMAALVSTGRLVYVPLGGRGRADLVIEDERGVARVQCKSGNIVGREVVMFSTCSHTGNQPKDYRGQIELFGVYVHERNEVYLVPVDEAPLRAASLRLTTGTRSGQRKGIRWAEPYRLTDRAVPRLFEPGDIEVAGCDE